MMSREMDDFIEKQVAVIYGYRYLLNREPEACGIIFDNRRTWEQIRADIMDSVEYKRINLATRMQQLGPYNSVTVCTNARGGDITYFFSKEDRVIPEYMLLCGKNWAQELIDQFIYAADKYFYSGTGPEKGLFLDIGGHIGTTSIYCSKKLKRNFRFIVFEPVTENRNLLAANAVFNGVQQELVIEKTALSNRKRESAVMVISRDNRGNCALAVGGKVLDPGTEESVTTDTLDCYLTEHGIERSEIKYIWIDVEGHELEVLEGAAALYRDYRIPTCLEFNQQWYKAEESRYEKMIELLEQLFRFFFVAGENQSGLEPRLIKEVRLLWEERQGQACDLLLF